MLGGKPTLLVIMKSVDSYMLITYRYSSGVGKFTPGHLAFMEDPRYLFLLAESCVLFFFYFYVKRRKLKITAFVLQQP